MYVDGFMIFMLLRLKIFFSISLYTAVFVASQLSPCCGRCFHPLTISVFEVSLPILGSWEVSEVSDFLNCVKLRHLQRSFSLIVLVSCPHLLLICLRFYMSRPSLDSASTCGTQVLLGETWPLIAGVSKYAASLFFPLDCSCDQS